MNLKFAGRSRVCIIDKELCLILIIFYNQNNFATFEKILFFKNILTYQHIALLMFVCVAFNNKNINKKVKYNFFLISGEHFIIDI